ncbi:NAD-dependent epimerase/dehydratase family protein [Candidatus Bathyarchaeota archaeon]|nr:NAD-dependent epimerase/dehydratase family protein [Candidatus Bathyarchaeota archaeon]
MGRACTNGGCAFFGRCLVCKLLKLVEEVVVIDNMSKGKPKNVHMFEDSSKFKKVVGDLLDSSRLEAAIEDCGLVFHLAANPQASIWYRDKEVDFQQNMVGTCNLLEAMRKSSHAKTLVFSSTSILW